MRIKLLFDKYLANDCTPEELEELLLLMQQEQHSGALTEDMRRAWDRLPLKPPSPQANWDAMMEQIKRQSTVRPARAGKVRKLALWASGAAAAVILLLVAVRRPQTGQQPAVQVMAGAGRYTVVKADTGKQFVYLPDGSTVVLNTGSSLRYERVFGKEREIFLEGEAYFDVKQDPGRPFTVRCGELSTRVLGTAFNINAYPGNKEIKVTVTQGKVQVDKKDKGTPGLLLVANEQAVFDREKESCMKQAVNAVKEIAWKPAELFFDDRTLSELAVFLEARYGRRIVIADAAAGAKRVSATFGEKDSLEEILTVICGVAGTTFTSSNNVITIK